MRCRRKLYISSVYKKMFSQNSPILFVLRLAKSCDIIFPTRRTHFFSSFPAVNRASFKQFVYQIKQLRTTTPQVDILLWCISYNNIILIFQCSVCPGRPIRRYGERKSPYCLSIMYFFINFFADPL